MKAENVVGHEDWLKARLELLAKENTFDRKRDELTRARQQMPWEKVETNYIFDGKDGKESLADLFGKQDQLVVYHFMHHPDWGGQPCKSCSF